MNRQQRTAYHEEANQCFTGQSNRYRKSFRRNNIWIIGQPERAEGDKPVEFSENLMTNVLGFKDMPVTFVVERAHRISF